MRIYTDSEVASRKVAESVIIEPAFAFGDREIGKAYWGDLTFANQASIIRLAMEFSGLIGEVKLADQKQEATAAAVGSFPSK
jgi:hypothetical protein